MTMHVHIRDETPRDVDIITELTVAAFEALEVSDHTEQFVIRALREAGDLTVSLVAEHDGCTVGHIAFSPVTVSDGTPGWYALGPVSVWPHMHHQGIGKALIHEGLARLLALGARGCCLVGHPEYYPRFGFLHTDRLVFPGVPAHVFFVLPFAGHVPEGTVSFHPAFGAKQ